MSPDPPATYLRLSVNLSLDTAAALRDLVVRRRITLTDGVRRAIAVWKFVEDEVARGNRLAVVEYENGRRCRIREVVMRRTDDPDVGNVCKIDDDVLRAERRRLRDVLLAQADLTDGPVVARPWRAVERAIDRAYGMRHAAALITAGDDEGEETSK